MNTSFEKLAAWLKVRPRVLALLLALVLLWCGAQQIQDFSRGFFDGLSQ